MPSTTDNFARSARTSLAVQILGIPTGLATSIISARSLGPTGKAELDLSLSACLLLGTIASCSLPTAITWALAKQPELARPLRPLPVWNAAATAVITAIFMPLLSPMLFPNGIPWIISFILVPLNTGMVVLVMGAKSWAIGLHRGARCAFSEFASRVGILAAFMALWWSSSSSSAIMLGTILAVSLVLGFALLRPSPAGGSEAISWRTLIGYAIAYQMANLIQVIATRADLFILDHTTDRRFVGLYSVGLTLTQLAWMPAGAIGPVLMARLASDGQGRVATAALLARLLTCLSVVAYIPCALILPMLVRWLYGAEFAPAAEVCLALLPGGIAFSTVVILVAVFSGDGRPRGYLLTALAFFFFTLGVLPLSIYLGAQPALATLLAMNGAGLSSLMVAAALAKRWYGIRLLDLLIIRQSDFSVAWKALVRHRANEA